jgi:hypothetical protein
MAWHMGEILAVVAFREAAVFDGAGVGTQDNGFLKRLKDSDTSHSPSRPSGGQLPSLDSASYRDVLLSRLSRTCLWRRLRSPPPPPPRHPLPAALRLSPRRSGSLPCRCSSLRQRLHTIHLLPRDKATHLSKFAPSGLLLLLHQRRFSLYLI